MSKKFFKKVAAMVATMTMAISTMAISASASSASFDLRFVRGAPASVNVISDDIYITATESSYVTLTCISFTTDAPGANGRGDAYNNVSVETNDVVFTGTGSYRMYYQGTLRPNTNARVRFHVNIEGYSGGNYVYTSGTLKT